MERIKSIPIQLVMVALIMLTLGMIGADLVLARKAACLETYYQEQLAPIQQKIACQNRRRQAAKNKAGEFRKIPLIWPPWSAQLICLAETKPEGASLESLQLQNKRVVLKGAATDDRDPRQWRERLEKSSFYKSVTVSQVHRKKGRVEFEIELETAP